MLNAGGHLDHLVALRNEGHCSDGRPVSGGARPACRVALLGLAIQRVSCRQDGLILPGVTLLRAHITDPAVAVLHVVPTHELGGPAASIVQRLKALRRERRAVLCRAEHHRGIQALRLARPRGRVHRHGQEQDALRVRVKVGIAATLKHNLIVGARAFTGNPFDGHTPRESSLKNPRSPHKHWTLG